MFHCCGNSKNAPDLFEASIDVILACRENTRHELEQAGKKTGWTRPLVTELVSEIDVDCSMGEERVSF